MILPELCIWTASSLRLLSYKWLQKRWEYITKETPSMIWSDGNMVHLWTTCAVETTSFSEKWKAGLKMVFCHPQSVQERYQYSLLQSSRGQKAEPRDKGDWFANHRTCRAQQWVWETEKRNPSKKKQVCDLQTCHFWH